MTGKDDDSFAGFVQGWNALVELKTPVGQEGLPAGAARQRREGLEVGHASPFRMSGTQDRAGLPSSNQMRIVTHLSCV